MPYSEFSNKKNEVTYRGDDRRDSMAYFHAFDIRLALVVIMLLGAMTAAFYVFAPDITDGSFLLRSTFFMASIALGIAGVLSILRWRLDGMAKSFWYGLACIISLLPLLGVEAPDRVGRSLLMGTTAAVGVLAIGALKSPAVDMAPKATRWILGAFGVGLLVLLIDFSKINLPHEFFSTALGLGVLIIFFVTLKGYKSSESLNGVWFAPTLFAIGLGPFVALAAGFNVIGSQNSGPMRLAAAGVALSGSILELHYAAARHQGLALHATIALDDEKALRAASSLASASQMHEVRSRVAAIEGGISAITVSAGDDALTEAIQSEIERLRRLIAPRLEPTYGPFRVIDALRSTLIVSASSSPVTFAIEEGLIALGNADDLAQVVHGLISNALRYAPGTPIEVSAESDGDHILIRVDDRGPGVARGQRDLIFERGWRGSKSFGGHGLGLSIARDIITKNGGGLWVSIRPGGGARFVVSLDSCRGLISIQGSGESADINDAPTIDIPVLSDVDRDRAHRRLGGEA